MKHDRHQQQCVAGFHSDIEKKGKNSFEIKISWEIKTIKVRRNA